MRRYGRRMVEEKALLECLCDGCGANISCDIIEAQEALHITFTGGFGSVFGDGVTFTTDLCQHCVQKRLGDVLTEIETE